MDFAKLANYLRTRFEVTKIFYYAGVDNENIKQIKFYEKLQQFGYGLRLVPVKTFKDGKKKAGVLSERKEDELLWIAWLIRSKTGLKWCVQAD